VAAETGCSPAEVAIPFCIFNASVARVIPGIRIPRQAREAAAAWQPLPPEVLAKLR